MNRGKRVYDFVSQEASLLEEEHERALLSGSRIPQFSLSETAIVPELEPVEVMRPVLNVVLIAMMLEEKLLITPE